MKIQKSISLLYVLLLFGQLLPAQHAVPLHTSVRWQIEQGIVQGNFPFHLSHKPFHSADISPFINPDTLLLSHPDTSSTQGWLYRKLRTEHLASVKTTELTLNFDILFDFRLGQERETGRTIYRNTRAGKVEGRLGNQITFFSTFYENQAGFPAYLDSFIRESWVVPGQGVKRDFRETGFDFNWAEGGFLWKPNQKFHVELAHGKKFIGNGYRSLLLSDNAFNYPYFSAGFSNRHIKYEKSAALMMHNIHNVNMGNYLFDRKFFSWHYLNVNLLKGDLQLSLFEGNMWANPDSTGKFDFNPAYINPVPVLTSITNKNNSILGLNVSASLFNTFQIYGQLLFDDAFGEQTSQPKNNVGYQAGFKYFDVFGLKGLFLLAEYNQVMPYTYAQANGIRSYTHYNQPLAHPLGANFRENVFQLNYQFKSFHFTTKFNLIAYGDDSQEQFCGKNILHAFNNNNHKESKFLQGIETHVNVFSGELVYILNPLTNMNMCVGYQARNFRSSLNSSISSTIFVAFRTSLSNFYYDF